MNSKQLSYVLCISMFFNGILADHNSHNNLSDQQLEIYENVSQKAPSTTNSTPTVKWKKNISQKVQLGLIGLSLLINLYKNYQLLTLPSTVLSEIPECVKTAFTQFDYNIADFTFYECPGLGYNAYVTGFSNSVTIGSYFLKYAPKHITHFMIGHEVAHHYLSHAIKRYLFLASLIGAQIAFHKYMLYAKNKYNATDNPYLYKLVYYGNKMNTFLNDNPILRSLLISIPMLALSRYQEYEADATAALLTGQAQGGIDLFSRLPRNPLPDVLSTHPDHPGRIAELLQFLIPAV